MQILNLRERKFVGHLEDGVIRSLAVQVFDVDKSLSSVSKMVQNRRRPVFDEGDGYIEDKATRGNILMIEHHGMHIVEMWIPRRGGDDPISSRLEKWFASLCVQLCL